MNRTKRPLAKKQLKSVRKAVRLAQGPQPKAASLKSDALSPTLKKYPTSVSKKDAATVADFRKKMVVKKLKKAHKVSKRTNVGVDATSPPQIIHMEGKRWLKTVVKQNVFRGKVLSKRLSKK